MHKKKLIEVAIPLDAINKESAREKSIRHGHPSSLHVWWARRPLATCRAVLFASLVDDPSADPDRFPTEEAQLAERDRLFGIIEELVAWDTSSTDEVLDRARAEILASCDGDLPPILDPFAGGGSIPLEGQRLGLEAHASDLNPVAVLMNKALIEVPPRFAEMPPVHPGQEGAVSLRSWPRAHGLAQDVRYYGEWMQREAERRLGHLYPKVHLPTTEGGGSTTALAWIWARTVRCPNPACGSETALASGLTLYSKSGKERWAVPIVEGGKLRFVIGGPEGEPPVAPKLGRGSDFVCLACGSTVKGSHIRAEGVAGRMGTRLMAVVAEGPRGRVYVDGSAEQEGIAHSASPSWEPTGPTPERLTGGTGHGYGLTDWGKLFTSRQLTSLGVFTDLVADAREQVLRHAIAFGLPDDGVSLRDGGRGARAYAEAVSLILGLSVGKLASFHNQMARWRAGEGKSAPAFGRQALPMVWDFTEVNPFAGAGGDWMGVVNGSASVLDRLPAGPPGFVEQKDATRIESSPVLVSTDPPYYDNISYADLSDFFYVWLRRGLAEIFPDECSTLLVPKAQELVAIPYRFGGDRAAADSFFESGLGSAFARVKAVHDPRFPLTVYYAFKQTESTQDGSASTGWETMLEGLLNAGFTVDGTWPMRTEGATRLIAGGANALATSIVLVCRQRSSTAPMASRKDFVAALRSALPSSVRAMQHGSIAPVDLAQSAIGPGMAVFSSYFKVVEADGAAMRVRAALELINQVLDETVAGTDADFDADTRWAITWFEDCGVNDGEFGRAEQLSKSRNTSVAGLADAGIVVQTPGRVRLTAREELPPEWDPKSDERLTVWEVAQHLIRRLDSDGEASAAALLADVGSGLGETAKELAYRLYLICERRKWAKEAISYNALVAAWPELTRLAASSEGTVDGPGTQGELL